MAPVRLRHRIRSRSPAHGRCAVGGDTRLFRLIYRGNPDYYPILARPQRLN